MGFSIPFCGTQNKDIVVLIVLCATLTHYFFIIQIQFFGQSGNLEPQYYCLVATKIGNKNRQ